MLEPTDKTMSVFSELFCKKGIECSLTHKTKSDLF